MSDSPATENSFHDAVAEVIEEIRPLLQGDGGDIELVSVEDGVVRVRLRGACAGCPMATSTLTEFVAFIRLGEVPAGEMSERTRMLMTYALCGFANIGSVGITVTGLSVLIPERREEVLGMVWKALFAGFLATLMAAAVVGAMPASIFR